MSSSPALVCSQRAWLSAGLQLVTRVVASRGGVGNAVVWSAVGFSWPQVQVGDGHVSERYRPDRTFIHSKFRNLSFRKVGSNFSKFLPHVSKAWTENCQDDGFPCYRGSVDIHDLVAQRTDSCVSTHPTKETLIPSPWEQAEGRCLGWCSDQDSNPQLTDPDFSTLTTQPYRLFLRSGRENNYEATFRPYLLSSLLSITFCSFMAKCCPMQFLLKVYIKIVSTAQ